MHHCNEHCGRLIDLDDPNLCLMDWIDGMCEVQGISPLLLTRVLRSLGIAHRPKVVDYARITQLERELGFGEGKSDG